MSRYAFEYRGGRYETERARNGIERVAGRLVRFRAAPARDAWVAGGDVYWRRFSVTTRTMPRGWTPRAAVPFGALQK